MGIKKELKRHDQQMPLCDNSRNVDFQGPTKPISPNVA